MNNPSHHLPHLLLFVHAVERMRRAKPGEADAVTMPSNLYLIREEETVFWELVGLVVRGLPSLMLGGLRFRRQSAEDGDFSRESLVSYLSSSRRELSMSQVPQPNDLVEVMMLDARKSVFKCLKECQSGPRKPTVFIDRKDILMAFDFRLANPSRHQRVESSEARRRYLFRTTSGHVLSALPHRLPGKLHQDHPFLALTEATQHTETRDHPLPTLAVHRRFLSMTAPIHDDATTWLLRSHPFHTGFANSEHLLDPELERYRRLRQREHREGALHSPPHQLALAS